MHSNSCYSLTIFSSNTKTEMSDKKENKKRQKRQYPLKKFQQDGRKLYKCQLCCYVTDRKNNLKRHIFTMHEQCGKILECCGIFFLNKAQLREHVSMFHRTGYSCAVCGRNFCRKALLRRHKALHNNDFQTSTDEINSINETNKKFFKGGNLFKVTEQSKEIKLHTEEERKQSGNRELWMRKRMFLNNRLSETYNDDSMNIKLNFENTCNQFKKDSSNMTTKSRLARYIYSCKCGLEFEKQICLVEHSLICKVFNSYSCTLNQLTIYVSNKTN